MDTLANLSQVVIAVVAVFALNSWEKQIKGGTKYTVAKNLLVGAKKVQEFTQKNLRNPGIHPNEAGREYNEKNYQYFVYQKRIKDTYNYKIDNFDNTAIEAEVLFGIEVKNLVDKFNKKINELRVAIYLGYGMLTGDEIHDKPLWELMHKKINENRELLWNTGLEDDRYSKELNAIVVEMEICLEKYIK